jgi:polyphenol oxidase
MSAFDRHADGMLVLRFPHLSAGHGVAARTGGVSEGAYASLNLGPRSGDDLDRVRTNRDRFQRALGSTGRPVLAPRQVHSATVTVVAHTDDLATTGGVVEGDAVVSDAPGVTLTLLAADCAAVLLFDPERAVAAAVHAGWRGTAGAIAARAVAAMVERFSSRPAAIEAAIGPAIGRCCYEVGPEVVAAVAAVTPGGAAPVTTAGPSGKPHLDLVAANRRQLEAVGLAPERVVAAGICTACRTDLFFSHRREGEPTGRFGAAITLPA